jgi:hypothetical protein
VAPVVRQLYLFPFRDFLISKSNGQQQLGRLSYFSTAGDAKIKNDFTWYAFLDTTILWVWPLETFLNAEGK